MSTSYDIGIIGALADEVASIIEMLEEHKVVSAGGVEFHTGRIYTRSVVVAKCGVGKVFAAICAEAMILEFSPALIVNSGVGGALDKSLRPLDIVLATKLVQHDMDTSPLGDPVGLISGINRVWFDTDPRALRILESAADALGVRHLSGAVATGDKFIAERCDKEHIVSIFNAVCCEMEGAAIAHTAFVNNTPFAVIRAISDSADGGACMDYPAFLPKAVKISTALTLQLIKAY